VAVGSESTRLIVLRGNSGSGKSTVAKALLDAHGGRGVAWVAQDLIRRTILREKDRPGAANIGLIDQIARYCLDQGYHAVVDGILYADRYEHMLAGLRRDHRGRSYFYYLDVSLDETIRRHTTRPQVAEFGPDDMRDWYRPRDLLSSIEERIIPETSTRQESTDRILAESQLLAARATLGIVTDQNAAEALDFSAYQQAAARTAGLIATDHPVVYPTLGLVSEAGEVAGKVKKIFRDRQGQITDADREALALELGDVLWYLSEICTRLGIRLEDVAARNIAKIADRASRGVLSGEGDLR
jgi:NTP pyrophosphatase (non-canonical NTP hydrolase)/predicted kinase